MKKINLIDKDIDELNNMLNNASKEYIKLLYDKASGALKDKSLLSKKRKDIARIKTSIRILKNKQ